LIFGRTTAFVGAISQGFPRESGAALDIGGVSTNFRMVDILAIGCGGATIVRVTENSTETQIEPDKVAFELTEKAMSWGCKCITTTDTAIANSFLTIDDTKCDSSRVASVDKAFVQSPAEKISKIIEDAIVE
jgi:N-methylhydantoinase A/oxoprolinase/acetone carboxylase beta subunit